jgi:hypothetical protein
MSQVAAAQACFYLLSRTTRSRNNVAKVVRLHLEPVSVSLSYLPSAETLPFFSAIPTSCQTKAISHCCPWVTQSPSFGSDIKTKKPIVLHSTFKLLPSWESERAMLNLTRVPCFRCSGAWPTPNVPDTSYKANPNPMQKHVMYFDRNHDGVISIPETYESEQQCILPSSNSFCRQIVYALNIAQPLDSESGLPTQKEISSRDKREEKEKGARLLAEGCCGYRYRHMLLNGSTCGWISFKHPQ